jgi:hypothetical protein
VTAFEWFDGGGENIPAKSGGILMADKHEHGQGAAKRYTAIAGILAFAAVILSPVAAAYASRSQPGEQAVRSVDMARVITRHGEWIEVEDEPLLGVIDEMNRRSKRKLIVDRSDPRLKSLRVTGRFKTDRPERLLQYIRGAGIEVWTTKDGDGNIVLRLRGEPSSS